MMKICFTSARRQVILLHAYDVHGAHGVRVGHGVHGAENVDGVENEDTAENVDVEDTAESAQGRQRALRPGWKVSRLVSRCPWTRHFLKLSRRSCSGWTTQ
jgi:hypothetical protein